nr:aldehyde dehydrogenase family protein [Sinobaca sp. H24]
MHELDLPKGVFNIVHGKGSTVGNTLASHPKMGMISMTGSFNAGSAVMEAAAKGITKVNLELAARHLLSYPSMLMWIWL